MKVLQRIAMTLSALALCTACSNEDEVFKNGGTTERSLTATIPAYQFDDGTRVNISDDLQTFTWSDGDKIGIYYDDANLETGAWYTIKQGGSNTGVFSNDAVYLNPEKNYYAFYPYSSTAITQSVEVDYTRQTLSGNGSAAHLSSYNYMYGSVIVNSKGSASIAFKNLSSVMQIQLVITNTSTYTGIDIISNNTEFITKGTACMTDGKITGTETSKIIHLDFQNDLTLNAGDILTANILTAPIDMSESTLTIILIDSNNNNYAITEIGKNMLQGKAYLYAGETIFYEPPYVSFSADAEQTFQMSEAVSTLEYSVNGGNWAELGTTQVTFGGSLGDLRLRGKSSVGTNEATISFGNETKVACSGDIRTLVDYENYYITYTGDALFRSLFGNCNQLTSAPELPATNLAGGCYEGMFYGCTALTQAPELPATNLASSCYSGMFSGCTALTQAPELPATNLATWCYNSMFYGCTALTQAPELPATNLAGDCYEGMFYGCTALTQAPELPATNLATWCYNFMFYGCTALTQAPELPATNLAGGCYEGMFYGCTALTQAPELPATKLSERCYSSMFYGCTSLTQAPELPATNLASSCYSGMFSGCTALTQAPELPATKLASSCYSSMFYGCTSLTQAPELPATNLASSCYSSMFYGCTSLTQAPELPATDLAQYCYSGMFSDCTSLTQAPELPATKLASSCYYHMFYGCSNLSHIRMMATNITALGNLSYWLYGVRSSGTFVKNKNATWDITGPSGIPEGWTIIYE